MLKLIKKSHQTEIIIEESKAQTDTSETSLAVKWAGAGKRFLVLLRIIEQDRELVKKMI